MTNASARSNYDVKQYYQATSERGLRYWDSKPELGDTLNRNNGSFYYIKELQRGILPNKDSWHSPLK